MQMSKRLSIASQCSLAGRVSANEFAGTLLRFAAVLNCFRSWMTSVSMVLLPGRFENLRAIVWFPTVA